MEGQKEGAYLRSEWMSAFTAKPEDFSYVKHEISELDPLLSWSTSTLVIWCIRKISEKCTPRC
ncbi:hypothetical protein [Sphingobacterium puteale]|uniref:hypothetical protein n=1 Tax=Sphingobacterium puteale TaxID=2420510 RepID=UPI0011C40622|nr:hypothetical protein [Sphingobacterium puteale]